jgi:hypothetical protein
MADMTKIPGSPAPTTGPRPVFPNKGRIVPKTQAPSPVTEGSIRPQ